MADKSIQCASCGQHMAVSDVPIPNHPPEIDVHLHATCENARCPQRGEVVHSDHIFGCNGLPGCPVHDYPKLHSAYRDCEGGQGCVLGCP
jgi:hypothetical protein